jgi:dipeptidyl aminopeptidase/acylaminoacyl peptidase
MVLVLVTTALGLPRAQTPARANLTIDDLVHIMHPSGYQWTPDGSHVWWTYDDGGVNNVWAAAADGKTPPVALTNYPDGQSGNGGIWSRDGKTFYFQHGGGLQSVPVNGGGPRPAWPSAARATGFAWSPDATRVAFVVSQPAPASAATPASAPAGADLFVHVFADNRDQLVAHADAAISGVNWSADAATITYTVGAGPGAGPTQHQTIRPEIGNKLIFIAYEGGRGGGAGGQAFTVPASGGTPAPVTAGGGRGGGRAGGVGGGGGRGGGGNQIDATHVLSTRTSNGGRTRTTESTDTTGGAATLLHEETADKFFSAVNTTANAMSPNRKWLLFTTDTTGWDQIYVMSTSGGPVTQLTKTPGDHWRAVWSHDSTRIAWDTNTKDAPGDRHIEMATIGDDPAKVVITTVTPGPGTNVSAQWSPDDTRLLYQHTDARTSAELYVATVSPTTTSAPIRLTSSMPSRIDRSMFVAPELIHYPGPDGKPVPAWLFVPKNLDRTKQHAAIVWIHPDGVNMNYDGFHPDRNEAVYYEFHQYLLQQGYVVIAPDYRGSIGYGRDWRNDVYMDVGGNDAKDARMAYTYLRTLGYVDPARVGVWGLSYGGFFTLLAVTQEPTWFAAAVNVAGVADYALYYEDPYHGGWTTSRIGTPTEHPDVYAKANPMAHVDQIQHPLLILHGTSDLNVPFIHSVLLVDALLKAGKGNLTSVMVYPGELHYFDRNFVVRDAWERVDAFFGQHLQPSKATAKPAR